VTLTPEQLAEIDKRMGEAIKNAFTGDAFKGALSAALAPAIEGATKPLAEKLATLEANATKQDPPPGKKDGDGKGVAPEVQAQIDALKAKLTESEAKAAATEAKAREDRALNASRDALLKAGVPASMVPFALARIKADGLVKYDDDGNPFFEAADAYGGKVKQDPVTWAGAYVKTDDGKALLPAAPVAGAGGQPGQPGFGRPSGKITSIDDFDKHLA
jgi:hypothetical protein